MPRTPSWCGAGRCRRSRPAARRPRARGATRRPGSSGATADEGAVAGLRRVHSRMPRPDRHACPSRPRLGPGGTDRRMVGERRRPRAEDGQAPAGGLARVPARDADAVTGVETGSAARSAGRPAGWLDAGGVDRDRAACGAPLVRIDPARRSRCAGHPRRERSPFTTSDADERSATRRSVEYPPARGRAGTASTDAVEGSIRTTIARTGPGLQPAHRRPRGTGSGAGRQSSHGHCAARGDEQEEREARGAETTSGHPSAAR